MFIVIYSDVRRRPRTLSQVWSAGINTPAPLSAVFVIYCYFYVLIFLLIHCKRVRWWWWWCAAIYSQQMCDESHGGLSSNVIATRILPSLIPLAVSPALDISQVIALAIWDGEWRWKRRLVLIPVHNHYSTFLFVAASLYPEQSYNPAPGYFVWLVRSPGTVYH